MLHVQKCSELEKIFDRFQQVDRGAADETAGTGLGLALASKIITEHNGTIVVNSKPGKTSFRISLPTTKTSGGAS